MRRASARYGTDISRRDTVIVGDAPADIGAALDAGVPVITVASGSSYRNNCGNSARNARCRAWPTRRGSSGPWSLTQGVSDTTTQLKSRRVGEALELNESLFPAPASRLCSALLDKNISQEP
ncbi:HAD hydrolase-like protein [Streptantibioticus silvisoli]|uniref:HAD hydrolase-like protein n=1 Tax=Streptantibioticus silvisoli TaxID=2705255 RepID=UPI0034DF7F9B